MWASLGLESLGGRFADLMAPAFQISRSEIREVEQSEILVCEICVDFSGVILPWLAISCHGVTAGDN